MRMSLLVACALVGAVAPLHAQKPRRQPPVLLPPSAPAASQPDSARVPKVHRPSPSLVVPGAANAARPADTTRRANNQPVAAQATGAAAAPVSGFTAGLAIASYAGESDDDLHRYLRRYTTQLDSAAALLVGLFRNTSGQPVAGADAPTALAARERERWNRCRDLHFDLRTYADAAPDLVDNLPESPAVQRAGAALDSSLTALEATAECDNIASMIAAPGRWTPWGAQYTTSARNFYQHWYPQLLEVSDRNRALVVALNTVLPAAARIAVPPALPRTPPYAGVAPR